MQCQADQMNSDKNRDSPYSPRWKVRQSTYAAYLHSMKMGRTALEQHVVGRNSMVGVPFGNGRFPLEFLTSRRRAAFLSLMMTLEAPSSLQG